MLRGGDYDPDDYVVGRFDDEVMTTMVRLIMKLVTILTMVMMTMTILSI